MRPDVPDDVAADGHAAVLAAQARQLVASAPDGARFLAGWPELKAVRQAQPRSLPVLRWMTDLEPLAPTATSAIVRALSAAFAGMEWRQTYAASDFGAAFLQAYGWTELVGTRGPIPSEEVACGFLLLGPHTLYPSHAHEAEELYLPLAGTGLWQMGGDEFTEKPPGCAIHHPSWTPHAMRTGDEPMLALYVWRGGDLAAKSKIVS